jgi:hypothetical protein
MIKDLYNGKELCSWIYTEDNPKPNDIQLVSISLYQNGITIGMPIDNFKQVVKELNRTLKTLELN